MGINSSEWEDAMDKMDELQKRGMSFPPNKGFTSSGFGTSSEDKEDDGEEDPETFSVNTDYPVLDEMKINEGISRIVLEEEPEDKDSLSDAVIEVAREERLSWCQNILYEESKSQLDL